jgi:predicted nuclease of predicted toxin-antitoxin system
MFLANENFPNPSTNILRQNGFDVRSIQEEVPGISDAEVIKLALQDNLIILTFDGDYGELIFRYSVENPPSIVFFREKGNTPEFAGNMLITLLKNNDILLRGAFTVIETNSVRQRFYKK